MLCFALSMAMPRLHILTSQSKPTGLPERRARRIPEGVRMGTESLMVTVGDQGVGRVARGAYRPSHLTV